MSEIDYSKIELLVLDVDGVLTDGRIIITPEGQEIKEFHVRDGTGMKYWRRLDKKIAIISGRSSKAIELRAKDLGVDAVRLGVKDKLPPYEDILKELGLAPDRTAVVGDDLMDIPLMLRCALPVAVADACQETRDVAAFVTSLPGGAGCVREIIEHILRQAGLWDKILARYMPREGLKI